MMPKIVSKLHSPYMRNKEEEDLIKSIGVVPAKYSLKIKLENFHNSRVQELGYIMGTLIFEGFGFFIVVWNRSLFLGEEGIFLWGRFS